MAGKKLDQDSLLGIKTYIDEGNARDEKLANKVTELSSSSTDTQYPSAKVVWDNMQNIREVAEGKCKTFVLSYNWTFSNIRTLGTKFYFVNSNGEYMDITNDLNDYDDLVYANHIFNSQSSAISIIDWVIFLDKDGNVIISQPSYICEIGDIILVLETDVPDRWFFRGSLFRLETSKVDLTQYYTKDQIAALFSSYITSPYDNTSNYAVGKYVTYNGALYRCVTAIDVAEDFDSNKWVAVTVGSELERMVTTDTNQTITGVKTFNSSAFKIQLATKPNSPLTFDFDTNASNNEARIVYLNNRMIVMSSLSVKIGKDLIPYSNTYSLGNSTFKWKDLYLSQNLTDGTNSVTIADVSNGIFNVINASDIVNNTLTQAQYDLITNGKPTLISGNLGNYNNSIILQSSIQSTYTYLTIIGQDGYGQSTFGNIRINNSTKVISLLTTYRLMINENGISLNGKTIPAYPSNTGTFSYKCVNGTLSWENEIPTSVSISNGDAISDTALQNLITRHRPIVLNGYTGYFSCDDGTNYQYHSIIFDSVNNVNHLNVITINKSTWVVTFHTSNFVLN